MNKQIKENFYEGYSDYLHHSLGLYKTKESLKNALGQGLVASGSAYVSVADFLLEQIDGFYKEEVTSDVVIKDINASKLRSIKGYSDYVDGIRALFIAPQDLGECLKRGRIATECGYYSIVDHLQFMLLEDKKKDQQELSYWQIKKFLLYLTY